jgi:hypothetical protein
MGKPLKWVGLCLLLAVGSACKKDEGQACFSNKECGEGLACVGEDLRRCEKCGEQQACTIYGRCTAQEGACVAAGDGECQQSADCKERGPCTAKDGKCVVGSDADCKQSEACAKERFCVAKGNNCIMSEADRKEADKLAAARAAAAAKEMEGRVEPPPEYDED